MFRKALRAAEAARSAALTYVYRRHGGNYSASGYWTQVVRSGVDDQARWPDPALAALQAEVDALRARPAPDLLAPVE